MEFKITQDNLLEFKLSFLIKNKLKYEILEFGIKNGFLSKNKRKDVFLLFLEDENYLDISPKVDLYFEFSDLIKSDIYRFSNPSYPGITNSLQDNIVDSISQIFIKHKVQSKLFYENMWNSVVLNIFHIMATLNRHVMGTLKD